MSNRALGWESIVHTDSPRGCALKAALFTTYDHADERLMVEHLLPSLLKLNREPEGSGKERQYFLLELDNRLKQLHDRIVVVSSSVRDEPEDLKLDGSDSYTWIWRSIRHLTVGGAGSAVQHAKLWLLHWGTAEESGNEYLEIVVSSANLTSAAFREQLQAAWRVCIELKPAPSTVRRGRWGVLPAFLEQLGVSAQRQSSLKPFVELLARADCPEGVSFLASVPGIYTRQALRRVPWGLAGLAGIAPPGRGRASVSILSPYVGAWTEKSLPLWCAEFGGVPERLELVWIDEHHPWAIDKRWRLPVDTRDQLKAVGAQFLQLHSAASLHEQHHQADLRWCHAKVYSFRRGSSQRLLVTSANFSTAAWGRERADGSIEIENFELGVCVDQGTWPLDGRLEPFDDIEDLFTVPHELRRPTSWISWANATWDGAVVCVQCRCKADKPLQGHVRCGGDPKAIADWEPGPGRGIRSARFAWTNTKRLPSVVELNCDGESVTVPVFDERPRDEREQDLPPGVDEAEAQSIRDELLFERYGGRAATGDGDSELDSPELESGEDDLAPPEGQDAGLQMSGDHDADSVAPTHSYDVPAFSLARRKLNIVDNWADQVAQTANPRTGEFERTVLRRDGELLREAFKRQSARESGNRPMMAIGPRIAAEELALRLKYFPED